MFKDNHNGNSPVRLDRTPPQTTLNHSPPMNLSGLRGPPHSEGLKIEAPLALRLTSANQLSTPQVTSPLRVQINSHSNRMMAAPSPHTHLLNHHSGIVRIAPQTPQSNGPVLHRPYSPPRLSWYPAFEWEDTMWTGISSICQSEFFLLGIDWGRFWTIRLNQNNCQVHLSFN